MTEIRFTTHMALEAWVKNELLSLWNNLEVAHRRTIGNNGLPRRDRNWSMECDGLADRIRSATALVGPPSWREAIGMSSIIDGWFTWANEKIGIDNADLPTLRDVNECIALRDGIGPYTVKS